MTLCAVEEKLKTLSENYLQEASLYIDFLFQKQKSENSQNENSAKEKTLSENADENSAKEKLKALEDLQKFRGRLSKNFDCKKELLLALDEKYDKKRIPFVA